MTPEEFAVLLTDEGQQLLTQLEDHDPAEELAVATRLRRNHDTALVSAALGQARLRQRAVAKFGAEDADRMYFTPNGVEQSTRALGGHPSRARASRRSGVRRLADLCGGIGGDALALARAGIAVLAVDRDPLTGAVARANAAALGLADLIEVRCADVTEIETAGYDAVFVDPARRTGRGRIFDPEAYSPPLSWAVGRGPTAPLRRAEDRAGHPARGGPGRRRGRVGLGRRGREGGGAVVRHGPRRRTRHPAARRARRCGPRHLPPAPGVRPVGRYLYEPDGAVIRAHLVAEVAAHWTAALIDPTIAYVTTDELRPTPYATAYEITDVLPFNLKKLKALLREREVGMLTVKKRGSAVEPEEVRRRVKPQGPRAATVFLTRVAGAPSMLVGQPV